jgi:sarcosine oxidase subunit beta
MHNSYAQSGSLPRYQDVMGCAMNILPAAGRIRLLRQWAGIMDMSMDGSPFIDRTDVPGLYLNAGWCYGGFKATPASGWCFAHTIARDEPHAVNAALTLSRYAEGRQIDETGGGPVANHH